jgi:hypothetical protein
MFLESEFYYVFGPALLVAVVLVIGFRFWEGKRENELEKAISDLKMDILSIGFLMLVLY